MRFKLDQESTLDNLQLIKTLNFYFYTFNTPQKTFKLKPLDKISKPIQSTNQT